VVDVTIICLVLLDGGVDCCKTITGPVIVDKSQIDVLAEVIVGLLCGLLRGRRLLRHMIGGNKVELSPLITQLSCVRAKGLRRGVGSMRSEAVARLPEDAGNAGGRTGVAHASAGHGTRWTHSTKPDVCGGRTAKPAGWCCTVGKGNKGLCWAGGMAADDGRARVCVLRNFGGRPGLTYYAVLQSC
jgi:hypothetical protein